MQTLLSNPRIVLAALAFALVLLLGVSAFMAVSNYNAAASGNGIVQVHEVGLDDFGGDPAEVQAMRVTLSM